MCRSSTNITQFPKARASAHKDKTPPNAPDGRTQAAVLQSDEVCKWILVTGIHNLNFSDDSIQAARSRSPGSIAQELNLLRDDQMNAKETNDQVSPAEASQGNVNLPLYDLTNHSRSMACRRTYHKAPNALQGCLRCVLYCVHSVASTDGH